jgi:hypothetical protein
MNKAEAIELAAQCWCTADTRHLTMQSELALIFAEVLVAVTEAQESQDYDILEEG